MRTLACRAPISQHKIFHDCLGNFTLLAKLTARMGRGKKAEAEAKREEYMLTIINSGTETCEGEEPFHTKKSHADKTGGLARKVKELSVTRRVVEQRWCAPVAQLCAMVDVWTCLRSREVFATQAYNFYWGKTFLFERLITMHLSSHWDFRLTLIVFIQCGIIFNNRDTLPSHQTTLVFLCASALQRQG